MTTGRNVERPASRRDRDGFTLLELVMVMVIICTVLGMAAPSLRGFFSSRRTTDAAADIVALTQLARSLSVSEGRLYRLNLDADEGTYWLTVQRAGTFERIASEFGRVFRLPEGTLATWQSPVSGDASGYIQFYPDGRTDPVAIRLEGAHGEIVNIVCPSATESVKASAGTEVTSR